MTCRAARRGLAFAAITLALVLPPAPALAETEPAPSMVEALAAMRERDQRILDIGWKLATANAPFCQDAVPAIGLMLLDTASFADPDAIGEALGARGVVVQAAAKGSPAQQAGWEFPAEVTLVDDTFTVAPIGAQTASWENIVRVNRAIADSLAEDGVVELRSPHLRDTRRSTRVTGMPSCNAVMEPRDGEDRARADGNRILIGSDFVGFAYPDEEFASAIAHEMAHIVLGHSAWLDASGRTRGNIRLTEREADRLAPWLLANAGYDPLAAERFMRRWGPEHGGGLFRKRTHDGWDERAENIAAEAALAAAAVDETGAADWQVRFRREFAR